MRKRITPHAKMPPMMGRFVTRADALPYTATPINMKATTCKKGKNFKSYKLDKKNAPM